MARLEKSFEVASRGAVPLGTGDVAYGDVVRKAFMGAGGGRRVLVGADGADTFNLVNLDGAFAGGRAKSLGLCDHWRAMYVAKGGDPAVAGWGSRDGNPVEVLEKGGFKHANQKWGKQKAALAEGSGYTGGYTVPVQFYADLLRLMAEKAFIRERCTVLPMQSRSMMVPALKQSSTTFARGQSQFFGGVVMSWTPEGATIAESDPVFREIELVARDLVFYTVASNQLLQDNAVALDTLLTTIFQEACAWSYDYYIIQGGASAAEPIGVVNAPGTYLQSRTAANQILMPDVVNMLSHLYTQSWDNACWVASQSIIPQLMQMTNNASNSPFLTWLNPAPYSGDGGPMAQRIPAMLCGIPIFWSEKASYLGQKGDLILADFSKYLVGDRLSIQIEVSPHVKFLTNQMVWRVIVRWDGTPWQDSPVTLADRTWQVSPMVCLNV